MNFSLGEPEFEAVRDGGRITYRLAFPTVCASLSVELPHILVTQACATIEHSDLEDSLKLTVLEVLRGYQDE